MRRIRATTANHPVTSYYLLTFAISWGGILLIVGGPGDIPGGVERVDRLIFPVLLAQFAGPSLASLIMTGLITGRAGYRELFSRMMQWRASTRWYAIALLPGPLLVLASALLLSPFSTEFMPRILTADDRSGLLLFGIVWGLVGGGLLEELGWTGFAVPGLRRRQGIFTTGIIVGLLWGIWHFLIAFWSVESFSGGHFRFAFIAGFLVFYLCSLPAYRVAMVWLYDRTGNLVLAMLMHASLSAATLILQPLNTGIFYLIWNLVFAALLWIVVAAFIPVGKGRPVIYEGADPEPNNGKHTEYHERIDHPRT